MKKEEISLIVQLLSRMKDAVSRLEKAEEKKDIEMLNTTKKEILQFQWHLKKLL